jgi:DNA repair protein RecN (Recombination protein N)
MLRSLSIRDIVLIDRLDITLETGLCTLTGETGAGKSILLDALGLALGGRGDSGLVAQRSERGTVAAAFDPPAGHPVWDLMADQDLATADGLILRRVIGSDSRGRAYINDEPVSIGLLRRIGASLVEIHGQGAESGLLDQATHRALLDGFAGHQSALDAVRTAHGAWQSAAEAAEAARAGWQSARQEEDYLRHLFAELTALQPEPGEETALTQNRERLMAAEKIGEGLREAHDTLARDGGVEDSLHQAIKAIDQVRSHAGDTLDVALAALERAGAEAAEAQQALASARHDLEMDSGRLEDLESRLFALRAAARKHDCSVDDLVGLAAKIGAQLTALDDGGQEVARLELAATAARQSLVKAAGKLRRSRIAAAKRLDKTIAAELAPLRLGKATFKTEILPLDDGHITGNGSERVGFLVATNKGAALAPLAKVASGGERARFMLALKVILARQGSAPTVIFDEVDSGIGGATADAVGERLARLAADLQVLVVTHSPQVAARADHHWRVSKSDDRTAATAVEALDDHGRGEEIARMLAGAEITDAARAAARSLLDGTHG